MYEQKQFRSRDVESVPSSEDSQLSIPEGHLILFLSPLSPVISSLSCNCRKIDY